MGRIIKKRGISGMVGKASSGASDSINADANALESAGFMVKPRKAKHAKIGLEHKILSSDHKAAATGEASERELIRNSFEHIGEAQPEKPTRLRFLSPVIKFFDYKFEFRPFSFLRAVFPRPAYDDVRPRVLNELKEVHKKEGDKREVNKHDGNSHGRDFN